MTERAAPGTALDRSFFARDSLAVAPELLGCTVSANGVTIRVTEVEAYRQDDPASHSFRGPTARTAVMFGPPGFLYIYFTYGMHFCANVSCGPDGAGAAVLLRAGEVVAGTEAARERRGERVSFRDLARGPARLAQALGWDRSDDGADLVGSVVAGSPALPVLAGPRTGISKAADLTWRFWIADDRYVSPYKRHPKAPPAALLERHGEGL
ncbi:DNA-3-methyladenine glycosylase [Glycomyces buryatensis]|uniref:Putative 3-methyladenine DNA glycosylase n=1 Tax=Glycomyces buryatensis TaxID=2570927 RepID=A0A4S8QE96_9ACTN|nr:DNA-3-methyladenine glycosylase [Glycomyces buryatensis]THV42913.1 DNA-3-methyladenine glycosylase [Glycomyces buryatensis]